MGILCAALQVDWLLLVVRIVLSWVTAFSAWSPPPAMAPVVGVIYDLTEPVMSFFRRFVPPIGAIDISPIVIFLVIGALQRALCS